MPFPLTRLFLFINMQNGSAKVYFFSQFNSATAGGTVRPKCFIGYPKTNPFKPSFSHCSLSSPSILSSGQFAYNCANQ